jgi:hypothetical protein
MTEVIENLNKHVKQYHQMKVMDGVVLNTLLQKISGYLYYLETVRASTHNQYEAFVSQKISEGNSVARAVNLANVEYPEMYMLRRRMEGGYKVLSAITSNLSWVKFEHQTIKNQ